MKRNVILSGRCATAGKSAFEKGRSKNKNVINGGSVLDVILSGGVPPQANPPLKKQE